MNGGPRNGGQRKTRQRDSIRGVFDAARRPLHAQEVLERAREQHPGVGIATVYRNLNLLVDEGWLKPVELPNEPVRYERSDLSHHHHFQCSACGRVFDVDGCVGDLDRLAPPGFRIRSHEILLYGTCATCNPD